MTVFGGPGNLKGPFGVRSYAVCNPSSITASEPITLIQTAIVCDSNVRFKAPKYIETDSNCP